MATSSSSNSRGRPRVETTKTKSSGKLISSPAQAKRETEKLREGRDQGKTGPKAIDRSSRPLI